MAYHLTYHDELAKPRYWNNGSGQRDELITRILLDILDELQAIRAVIAEHQNDEIINATGER